MSLERSSQLQERQQLNNNNKKVFTSGRISTTSSPSISAFANAENQPFALRYYAANGNENQENQPLSEPFEVTKNENKKNEPLLKPFVLTKNENQQFAERNFNNNNMKKNENQGDQSLPQPFSLKPNENQKQFSARNFNYEDINIMKNKNENQPLPQPFALKKNENQENQQFFGTPVLRKFAEVTEVCGSCSKTFKMDSNCPNSSRN